VILLEKAQVGIQRCHVGGMYYWKKHPYLHPKFAKNPVKDRRNNGRETKYAKKFQRRFLETQQ